MVCRQAVPAFAVPPGGAAACDGVLRDWRGSGGGNISYRAGHEHWISRDAAGSLARCDRARVAHQTWRRRHPRLRSADGQTLLGAVTTAEKTHSPSDASSYV